MQTGEGNVFNGALEENVIRYKPQSQSSASCVCLSSFGLFPCLSSVLVEYVKAADVKVIAALGDSLTVSDEVVGFFLQKNLETGL